MSFKVQERFRVTNAGRLSSDASYGNNGVFRIPFRSRKAGHNVILECIASDGEGWEHVSVKPTLPRTPKWSEMQFIKEQFWGKDDLVVQFHPPESSYINKHPYVLHLWRKKDTNDFCERPEIWMV